MTDEIKAACSRLQSKLARARNAAAECRLYDDLTAASRWDNEARVIVECIRVVVGHSMCVECGEQRDLEGATDTLCHDCAAEAP